MGMRNEIEHIPLVISPLVDLDGIVSRNEVTHRDKE